MSTFFRTPFGIVKNDVIAKMKHKGYEIIKPSTSNVYQIYTPNDGLRIGSAYSLDEAVAEIESFIRDRADRSGKIR